MVLLVVLVHNWSTCLGVYHISLYEYMLIIYKAVYSSAESSTQAMLCKHVLVKTITYTFNGCTK